MVENSSSRPAGRVKWRRFAIAAVPAVAIAGTLVGLTAKGVLASGISISGTEYVVSASNLTGQGFEQFGTLITPDNGSTTPTPVVESAMSSATLSNLCQQVNLPDGLGTLVLTAGTPTDPATATGLIVDASGQTGTQAVFDNINIGVDASTLNEDKATNAPEGAAGSFGQEADSADITDLYQQTWLTSAGTFTLPDLSLSFGGTCPTYGSTLAGS